MFGTTLLEPAGGRDLLSRDGTDMIGAGIETLASENLDHLADQALRNQLSALLHQRTRLEAQISRRISRAKHRGIATADGAATLPAWLRAHAGLGEGEARTLTHDATHLEEMPATRRAYEAGEISTTRMRMLTTAHAPGYETPFAAIENALVDVAKIGTLPDLRTALGYWRSNIDNDGGSQAARRLHERRGLWASRTFGGNVAIRGDLDPEGGELLIAALAAYTPTPNDQRSAAQRRADTLTDICRLALDSKLPGGTTRPHLSIIIDADTLTTAATTLPGIGTAPITSLEPPNPTCELEYHGPILPATAIRLACDAAITRVVLGPHSQLIDLGRTTRTIPPNLRRALAARDRHCRFPNCDRPLAWCHLHHITHWLHGGPTNHNNLIHLCGHHHHLLHEGQWNATHNGTHLTITPPNGP